MRHIPVLLHETIDGLAICKGDVVVDGTLGSGGHSTEICRKFGTTVKLYGIDLETDALKRAAKKLQDTGCTGTFIHGNFKDMPELLRAQGVSKVDRILLDLGISSDELDSSGRGFSFLRDEPLLMTLDDVPTDETVTARDAINTWSEETLADVIYGFGEERYARRIAKGIIEARKNNPFQTTFDLVAVIQSSVPASYRRGKIHPATKTFQALRIAVNGELSSLQTALENCVPFLNTKGRMAVISFHSLEDRIVKNFFKQEAQKGTIMILTKKPLVPTQTEIKTNPRSRSAKLRIIEKK